MFKNMKLGLKMGIGFGVVIVLVGIVGGLSILNMLKIQNDSIKLKDEYVPEVAMVNQIERSSLQTMYAMRGYSLNFDEAFYRDAEIGLTAVYEALKAAENHAATYTDLKALNEGVGKARKEVDLYKSLAEDTKTEIDLIMGFRDTADSAATIFMENCNNYLESQNMAMEREIQNNANQAALSSRLKKITLINNIIDLGNALRVANFKGQLFNDAAGMQEALSNFAEVDSVLREIRKITAQQVNIKQLEEIERTGALYEGAMESIIKSYSNLNVISGERGEAAEQVLTVAQEVAGVGIETTQSIADGAVNTIRASVMIIIVGVIVSLVIALIVAVFLTRIITSALIKGVEFAQKLATGDLTAQLDVVQKDELGILAQALRNMRDKLAEVVGTVITGAEQIATASEELAEGNQDLSNRTEQQASALEETSSAIEEMNASIKSNADNTTAADNLAREAVSKADTGEMTISKMINSMDEINSSSSQIAAIIEVITNIAFQTNLLALNASIEAARAGEQGKGFAVVAVEVRKLAKRSDKAANEITSIIKNSNAKVTEGVEIANEAGAMLKEINESVKKVTALVGEIAAASQEQLTSADQIDQTLGSLDENTQKNAALVEEAASATEELSAQAQELSSAINYFTISREQTSRPKKEGKKETPLLGEPKGNTHKPEPHTQATRQAFSDLVDKGDFDEF